VKAEGILARLLGRIHRGIGRP